MYVLHTYKYINKHVVKNEFSGNKILINIPINRITIIILLITLNVISNVLSRLHGDIIVYY